MNDESKINSLRETIALSIEAHELMVIELSKAHRKVKRLQAERDKLRNQVEELKGGSVHNEKADDNRRQ